ncbi:hypothetical protein D3C76_489090 [compost metagenome]
MMLAKLMERLSKRLFVKALLPVSHNGLIKMMLILKLLFQEPVLNRRKAYFACDFSLIGISHNRFNMLT